MQYWRMQYHKVHQKLELRAIKICQMLSKVQVGEISKNYLFDFP